MRTVSIAEARRNLKALLDEVSSGREITLIRRGKEVARLVPPAGQTLRRLPALGAFRRSIRVTGAPMSREVLRARREARY